MWLTPQSPHSTHAAAPNRLRPTLTYASRKASSRSRFTRSTARGLGSSLACGRGPGGRADGQVSSYAAKA